VVAGIRGVVAGIRGVVAGIRGVVAGIRGVVAGTGGVVAGTGGGVAASGGKVGLLFTTVAAANGKVASIRITNGVTIFIISTYRRHTLMFFSNIFLDAGSGRAYAEAEPLTIEANMPTDVLRLDAGWTFDSGQRMDEPPLGTLPVTPPVHRQRGAKVMAQDYIPKPRDARYRWYKNLSANIVAEAVKFGGVAADATAVKSVADGIIAKMDATKTASDALDTARTLEANTEAAGLAQIRAKVRNWKSLSGWTASGSEGVLELSGSSVTFDPATYQTTLTVSVVPGGVQVDFVKKGVEGVAIYHKVNAAATWTKIGSCNHSPFLDNSPLAAAGVPEVRHYMARGLVNDAEIGVDSAAVSVTFAG